MTTPALLPENDPLFTVAEVAKELRINRHNVTAMFAKEPDVIIYGSKESTRKSRKYRQLRIPRHCIERVLGRLKVRAGEGAR